MIYIWKVEANNWLQSVTARMTTTAYLGRSVRGKHPKRRSCNPTVQNFAVQYQAEPDFILHVNVNQTFRGFLKEIAFLCK